MSDTNNQETFKPGDRVRVASGYWKGVCGTVTEIKGEFTRFRCDKGSVYSDGTPVNKGYIDRAAGMYHHELEKIEVAPNDMQDDGKWGAEIAVDGKRPEWLKAGPQPILLHNSVGWHTFNCENVDPAKVGWAFTSDGRPNVDIIRLPADHPHYRQGQASEAQTLTAQEHLARMEALVRRMAALNPVSEVAMMHTHEFDEARALVAAMEPVVDGDLVEARNQLALYGWTSDDTDYQAVMDLAENCIKRGRALAEGEGK